MLLSRWKMMAGILGVSLGGLAAMAGQCSKTDPVKSAAALDIPVVSTSASAPVVPPASTIPPIPAPEPMKPMSLPAAPVVVPASGTIPVPPPASEPVIPATTPLPQSAPTVPPMENVLPPLASGTSPAAPPMHVPADPGIDTSPSHLNIVKPAANVTTPVNAAAQTAYRILLRVGEGEPVFEIRSGDNLMLKVICEKVDVKSPEKGGGLSDVKACGKVRFVGFGAEGICDQLNFLAGSGEVTMTGNVKIQVKDKLGRVESELSGELMKYKIDPHAIAGNGQLKP